MADGTQKPVTIEHLERGVELRAGCAIVLVVGEQDSADEPAGGEVEIDWHFVHGDGKSLGSERYTLHFSDGSTTRAGALRAGHLVARVPAGDHLAVDIAGYGHVEADAAQVEASPGAAATPAPGNEAQQPADDEEVDLDWSFVHHDGSPLADEAFVLHFADGTTRDGRLQGGRLQLRVANRHVALDIAGFAHLEADAA